MIVPPIVGHSASDMSGIILSAEIATTASPTQADRSRAGAGMAGDPPARVSDGSAPIEDPHNDVFFAAVETTRMPMVITDP